MTNVTVLEQLAKCCRRGLVSLCELPGSAFSGFPKGSCGPAAEIVGRILKEEAGYEGVYVCGHRHPQLKPWPSPTTTDTFDRYDVPIGGITWHVKDGCSQKSLSARRSSW